MKHFFLTVSFILVVFINGCGGSGGQQSDFVAISSSSDSTSSQSIASTSSTATSSENSLVLATAIDNYLAANIGVDSPGISVLVVKNGQLAYSGGRGMADISAGISVTSNTGFRLASVSKSFTAIAIMQLVEKGELRLDDSLLDYIPELPASWRKITIEHLLTHKSGIYDIINDRWPPTALNGMTQAGLITYLVKNPALEFEPGTQCDYSNTGYMLLANVIERKTGLSFAAYMQEHIFGPANMSNSYINDENQPIKYGDALNRAQLRTYYGITTYLKGSMGQVSSGSDFFHFFEALRNNTLVSSQTLTNMFAPHGTLQGPNVGYGFGFIVVADYVGHSGDWDGFQTEMGLVKAKGMEFAILTNSGSRAHIEGIKNVIFNTTF